MDALERHARYDRLVQRVDPRIKLIVTCVYLVCLLSVDLLNVPALIPFLIYPVAVCRLGGVPILPLLRQSLIALPFCAMIGLFNPVFDHNPAFSIGGVVVSDGWVSFASIILRGILTVLATLTLIATTGFPAICAAMRRLGVPGILATQCLLLYRYIFLLMEDASRLSTARELRSYGTRKTPLRFWGPMVGSLLIHSINRAERIHTAMASRGFQGVTHTLGERPAKWPDLLYGTSWCVILLLLRWGDTVLLVGDNTQSFLS